MEAAASGHEIIVQYLLDHVSTSSSGWDHLFPIIFMGFTQQNKTLRTLNMESQWALSHIMTS